MRPLVSRDNLIAQLKEGLDHEPLLLTEKPDIASKVPIEAIADIDTNTSLLRSPPKALQTMEAAGFWQKRIDFFCKSTKQLAKKTVDAAVAAATSSSPFRGTGRSPGCGIGLTRFLQA